MPRVVLTQSVEECLNFVREVPEEIKCPYHGGILQDPVVGPCGHSFCKSCVCANDIYSELVEIQECPLCEEPITPPLFPNNFATAIICQLEVRCHFSSECNEIVRLGELSIHRSMCHMNKNTTETDDRRLYELPSLPRMSLGMSKLAWEINFKELKLLSRLGVGAFGEVFKATFRGTYVAVKKLIVRANSEEERMKEFSHELQFLKSVRHPNIILFIGACLQRNNLCIVMEFMNHGNLREAIDDMVRAKVPHNWVQFIGWCIDAATGLAYLHGQNIIHRDVKSNNLLIYEGGLKVADFGLARMEDSKEKSQAGNWAWMAPEMLRSEKTYGKKVDVYSFGICLAEILTGLMAEDIPRNGDMVLDGVEIKKLTPDGTPPGFQKLVLACCKNNPEERPTFKVITKSLERMKVLCTNDGIRQSLPPSGIKFTTT